LLKALHEPIEGRLGRGEHEVHVVGHQAVGKEAHGVSRPVHPEPVERGVVVPVTEEYRLPVIAAGDDVVKETRTEDAWLPSHAALAERVPGSVRRRARIKARA
jgi:hypothetical protein